MFEQFPYANFHELNLDWIIKIAKDFLDQYTHIQEVISNGEQSLQNLTSEGLTTLQEKTDALEALLQTWYDTHSQDIANELLNALTDLNTWYTTHQSYLDQHLTDSIATFNQAANQKTAESIASIPADYATLAGSVQQMNTDMYNLQRIYNDGVDNARALTATGKRVQEGSTIHSFPVTAGDVLRVNLINWTGGDVLWFFQDTITVPWSDNTHIIGSVHSGSQFSGDIIVPTGATYLVTNMDQNTAQSRVYKLTLKDFMRYYGTMSGGPFTNAKVGMYAVSSENVTGLPSGMSQLYGWLTCYVPNNLYTLVESNTSKTTWVKEGSSDWVKQFPLTLYKGTLTGDIHTAQTGTYAVSSENVTGLPSGMSQLYGWLTCYVPNNLYTLVESNTSKTTWVKEGSSDWVKQFPSETHESRLKNKKIAYNGDSIAESRFSGYSNNGGSYPYIISQLTSGTYSNSAVSGGTLAVSTESHQVCTSITSMPDDADIICLEGGINDYWLNIPLGDYNESDFSSAVNNETVCGALESIFRQSINKWVGKPIVFVIVHKITTTAWTPNDAGYTFADMREKIIGICNKYSIPYLDMWAEGGLNAYMPALNTAYLNGGASTHPDGCHPDANGYKKYYVPRLIKLFESLLSYD